MNPISRIVLLCLALLPMVVPPQANASDPVAKVYSFKGEVIILSGMEVFRLTEPAFPLKDGDQIQTKQGEATVHFDDGAVMRVSPFSSITIRQREEKRGFWIFKVTRSVRRITCFVGKLWFKTGTSKRRNYLQTPTAVCGVRGTTIEGGYDNTVSLLNVIAGLVDKVGPWEEGPFSNPGRLKALENRVFQAVEQALSLMEKAKATGDPVDLARAEMAALGVVIAAAELLATNPDETIRDEAGEAADAARELIAEIQKSIPGAVPPRPVPPKRPPPQPPLKVPLPDTETTEQEEYQEEASPSQ